MFYIITAVTIDAFGNSLPADSANKDCTQRPETGATDSDKTLLEASARTQPATANPLSAVGVTMNKARRASLRKRSD
jgi:hypothetical protein